MLCFRCFAHSCRLEHCWWLRETEMALKVWGNTHRHRCASRYTLTLTDWVFQA